MIIMKIHPELCWEPESLFRAVRRTVAVTGWWTVPGPWAIAKRALHRTA